MRFLTVLVVAVPLLGGDLENFTDNSLNTTQRNSACFALRGERSAEAVGAMRAALSDAGLQACAAANLRVAGAYGELSEEVREGKSPGARAAAARELGTLERREFLDILGAAARDRDVLVSSNAIEGLMRYDDHSSAAELRAIAVLGGMQTALALDILIDWRDPEVPEIGRRLLRAKSPADQMAGVRALGLTGDTSDLRMLHELAGSDSEMNGGTRGFGFMPAVSLARAAKTAIANIEQRSKK